MKSSCISHPKNEPLILIRQWQVDFCNGDHCAAALLSFFEYWHNIKIEQARKATKSNEIAEMHGDNGVQDDSLLQFHTAEDLEKGILGLFGRNKILKAIEFLESVGVVAVTNNPNPRYHFDRTKYFLFNPDACNDWMSEKKSSTRQNGTIENPKKDAGGLKRDDGRLKKDALPYSGDYLRDYNREKEARALDFSSSRNGKAEDKRSKALSMVRSLYDQKIIPTFREKTGGEYGDIDPQSAVTLAQFVERDVNGQSMEQRAEIVAGAFERYFGDKYWEKQGFPFRGFVTQMSKYTTAGSKTKATRRGPHTHGLQLCDDPDCTRYDQDDGLGDD